MSLSKLILNGGKHQSSDTVCWCRLASLYAVIDALFLPQASLYHSSFKKCFEESSEV